MSLNDSKSNSLYSPKIKLKKPTKKLFSGYRNVSFFKNTLPISLKKKKLSFKKK
jgi:hypothetical protein